MRFLLTFLFSTALQLVFAQVDCEHVIKQHEIAINKCQSGQHQETIAGFYNNVILRLKGCDCCDPLILKEAYYYSGVSRFALGSIRGAQRDFEACLKVIIKDDRRAKKISEKAEIELAKVMALIHETSANSKTKTSVAKKTTDPKQKNKKRSLGEESILSIAWAKPKATQFLDGIWMIKEKKEKIIVEIFSNNVLKKEYIELLLNEQAVPAKFTRQAKINHELINDDTYKKYIFETIVEFEKGFQQLQVRVKTSEHKMAKTEKISVVYNNDIKEEEIDITIPVVSIEYLGDRGIQEEINEKFMNVEFKIISEFDIGEEHCKLYVNGKPNNGQPSFQEVIAEGSLPEYIYSEKIDINKKAQQKIYLEILLPDGTVKESNTVLFPQ